MSLPNADRAVLNAAKIRDYLLSEIHPVGRFKAAFFIAHGYSSDRWELLRSDLLELARVGATSSKPGAFGRTFEVDGILSGRSANVRAVWIIRAMEDSPRFVTAFPRCFMFRLLDTVVLKRDVPEAGLRVGYLGAIVEVHDADIFKVEFVAASGRTQALVTLCLDDIRHVNDRDLITVRSLQRAVG